MPSYDKDETSTSPWALHEARRVFFTEKLNLTIFFQRAKCKKISPTKSPLADVPKIKIHPSTSGLGQWVTVPSLVTIFWWEGAFFCEKRISAMQNRHPEIARDMRAPHIAQKSLKRSLAPGLLNSSTLGVIGVEIQGTFSGRCCRCLDPDYSAHRAVLTACTHGW